MLYIYRSIHNAVPGDTRVDEKEQEKVDKYQDLTREIKISGRLKPE